MSCILDSLKTTLRRHGFSARTTYLDQPPRVGDIDLCAGLAVKMDRRAVGQGAGLLEGDIAFMAVQVKQAGTRRPRPFVNWPCC